MKQNAILFDDEILLLRPLSGPLDVGYIERELDSIPGALRDPHEKNMWILVVPAFERELVRKRREKDPSYHSANARVSLFPNQGVIEVMPGLTTLDWGRAQKFVQWLLSHGPWQLTVRGKVVGRAAILSDVYAQAWPDPDVAVTQTESPPRTGQLLTLHRNHNDLSEEVAVHDSGFMSYTRSHNGNEQVWRGRLTAELLARWPVLVKGLSMRSNDENPGYEYADPVFLTIEVPTDLDTAKLDLAHLRPEDRELVMLLNGWAKEFSRDANATPAGLVDLIPPEANGK